MSIQTLTVTPAQACISLASVFQNPLLEDGSTPSHAAERRELASLTSRAQQACLGCPTMQRCLYAAVVDHDVAGYVAGTTERQRGRIRQHLGVIVHPEDLDSFAGAHTGHRSIDPVEVARMRAANPHESLEALADRLGCSLSTVKRHLRKVRNGTVTEQRSRGIRPSMAQVLAATSAVVAGIDLTVVGEQAA